MMLNISIIIPTFNRKNLLERALTSVTTQTRPTEEIIVVDDGSEDETESLVRKQFPDVRYFRQQNRGVSSARNLGIRQATGNWIAFLDSDDEWLPQKLEKQCEVIQVQPQFQICHTNEIWIRRGKRVNQKKKHAKSGGYIFKKCLPLCVISPSSVLIHQEIFENVGLFDESLPACEDYDLWLRICSRYPVFYLDEALIVKYGGHRDQLSRKTWGLDRFRIQALEKIINSGQLQEDDCLAAIEMLVEKLKIFIEGAQKRGKNEEAESYRRKLGAYQSEISAPARRQSTD